MQQDSVLGTPNDPRTLHRYAYAFNNPVNYTDPAGLMPDLGNRYSQNRRTRLTTSYAPSGYAPLPGTQTSPYLPARPGGFNQPYLGGPLYGYDPLFPSPPRSINGPADQKWQTQSDPHARRQSQGYRPQACGPSGSPLDPLFALRDAGRSVIDAAQTEVEAFNTDPLRYSEKRWEEIESWAREGYRWTKRRWWQRVEEGRQDWHELEKCLANSLTTVKREIT